MDQPTSSEITLKDIAEAAGVSVAAVSKVLNNREGVSAATRERVQQVVDDLGYRGRSGRVGGGSTASIVTLEQYVTNDAFYGDMISGIANFASRAGIDVKMQVFASADEILDSRLSAADIEPLFLVGIDQPKVLDFLAGISANAVIVNGMDRSMRFSSVSPDYHFGAWLATRHLIGLGHRDIVHVTHPYRESFRRRIDGFRNALEEEGVSFDPARHLIDLGSPANISLAAKDIVAKEIEARPGPPTAIFCVNDMVALGVLNALASLGLSVPGDISVIGFDGLPIGGYADPQLSSIRSDRSMVGRIAVSLLAERTADPSLPAQRVMTGVDLLLRRSTAPPGA